MTQLMSFDEFLDTRIAKRQQQKQEQADPALSPFEQFLEERSQKRVAQNERNAQGRAEIFRDDPIASGNELGGIATGLATAGASLAAPLVRPFSGDAADFIQAESAAVQQAQQANVQEQDYGAVRGFINRNLPGAVSSVSQAAALGASAGLPGIVAGFGAGSGDRSYYDARQAGLTKQGAAEFAAKDAALEVAPMLVFQGLSKFVPAAAGLEGMFLKPINQAGVRNLAKSAAIAVGSEMTEEGITAVGQALNQASSLPGSEDAANWTGEDGTFASSPMAKTLQQTFEQTFLALGLGKAIRQLSPAERAQTTEFVQNQSRRGFEKLPDAVKTPLKKVFGKDRKAAAEFIKPLNEAEQQMVDNLPSESQILGEDVEQPLQETTVPESAVPAPETTPVEVPPVDPITEPTVAEVPPQSVSEPLTPPVEPEITPVDPIESRIQELEAVVKDYVDRTDDVSVYSDLEEAADSGDQNALLQTLEQTVQRISEPIVPDTETLEPEAVQPQPVQQPIQPPIQPPAEVSPPPSGPLQPDVPQSELTQPQTTAPGAIPESQQAQELQPEVQEPIADSPSAEPRLPPKGSIYETQVGGKPRFAVRGESEDGFGDELFDSREEAEQRIEQKRRLDELNAKFRTEQDAKQQKKEEAEQAERAEYEDLDGFADDKPAMKIGAVRKVLNKTVKHNGKIKKRKDIIREKVKAGWHVDEFKGKPTIADDDGSFLPLNKTEADYATYLLNRPASIPDLTQYKSKTQTGTSQEVFGEISRYGIAEVLRGEAEPMLDINREPTGWLKKDTSTGTILVNPQQDQVVKFDGGNPRSGTEKQRAQAEAQSFAMDNPLQPEPSPPSQPSPPQGELVTTPIFEPKPANKERNETDSASVEQSNVRKPPAGYQPLAEFTPVVFETKSPDLTLEDNITDMKAGGFKPGDVVGYRVYPKKNSSKGAYWQYGTVENVTSSHAVVKWSESDVVKSVGASLLKKLTPTAESRATGGQLAGKTQSNYGKSEDSEQEIYSNPEAFDRAKQAFRDSIERRGVADAPDGSTIKIVPDPVNEGRYVVETTTPDGMRSTKGDSRVGWSLPGAQAKAQEAAGLSPYMRPAETTNEVAEPQTDLSQADPATVSPETVPEPSPISEPEAPQVEAAPATQEEQPDEFDSAMDAALDDVFGPDPAKVERPKAKAVGPRGQFAIPGMEKATEEIEQRDAEFAKYEPFAEEIEKVSDKELANSFRSGVRALYPEVSRQIQKNDFAGVDSVLLDLTEEMTGRQTLDVPDAVTEAANLMVDRAVANAPGIQGFKPGDKVLYDQFDEGAEQYTVKGFVREDDDVFAQIRNKSGKILDVEIDDLQPAPRPKRKKSLKQKADARKQRTSKEYAAKLDAFKKAAGIDGSTARSGIDPTILKAAAELTKAAIDDSISTFAQYTAKIIEDIGPDNARKFSEYFERSWDRLGKRSDYQHIDAAGKVADYLGESSDNTTSSKEEESVSDSDSGRSEREGSTDSGELEESSTERIPPAKGKRRPGKRNKKPGKTSVRNDQQSDGPGDAADGSGTDSREGVRSDSRREDSPNYRIEPEDGIGEKFRKKERFRKNIDAIKLLKDLEQTGRLATADEQAVLAQYVGWGGLKEAVSTRDDQWVKEKAELEELLSDDELGSVKRSVRNAHYTSPEIIDSMWNGLREAGFNGGRILEPSAGVGHFFGMMDDQTMAESELDAIEMDSISARISRQLYPTANVVHAPYQEVSIPDGMYDLVISNVPFGQGSVNDSYDKDLKKINQPVHNFFFMKAMKNVRPGGVVAFITSRYTMDGTTKNHNTLRKGIGKLGGKFVGAVRLPNNAFKGIADTGVTTDVIFIQKSNDGSAVENPEWETVQAGMHRSDSYNHYYYDHPENMLGNMEEGAGTQPEEPGLAPDSDIDVADSLRKIIADLKFDQKGLELKSEVGVEADSEFAVERIPVSSMKLKQEVNNGWLVPKGDKLYRREGEFFVSQPIPYKSAKSLERIKAMDKLRRVRRDLMDMELDSNATAESIESIRKSLNDTYDKFVKEYGFLNTTRNRATFKNDDDVYMLMGLEHWDSVEKTATKIDVFEKRVSVPEVVPDRAETAQDAVTISLATKGMIDTGRVAELLGVSRAEAASQLESVAYRVPGTDQFQDADEYLSGNIKEKLDAAEKAAKKDSLYQRHVEDLKKVLPEPRDPSRITTTLKSPWLKPQHIENFISHVSGVPASSVTVEPVPVSGRFSVEVNAPGTSLNDSDFGTRRRKATDIVKRILNNKDMTVRDRLPDGSTIINPEATAAANAKAEKIRREFDKWLGKDADRLKETVDEYNNNYNVFVEKQSDGKHLINPDTGALYGANTNIQLRPHQLSAVWRAVQGNTLLAHEVGLGKTYIMASAIMEKKRLGLAKKQMLVVPNHLIEQFPREFKQLYPTAKILAPTSKDFNPAGRRTMLERVRNGDWDAVIVPMSSFKKIPVSPQRIKAKFSEQLEKLEAEIKKRKADKGTDNKNFIAELEAAKERLQTHMTKMMDAANKDSGPYFDEMGIDGLSVDEAHEFKNLWFMTSMNRIPGVNSTGNQTTFDMWIKSEFLNNRTGEKGITFATGTPISNSVSEMYTMMRYLQPELLKKMGLEEFDRWAGAFGDAVTDIEVTPTGDGFREHTRFKRFTNVQQLSDMFRQVADVKFASDVDMNKDRPAIKGGKPITIEAAPSLPLLQLVKSLSDRMKAIRQGNREDNALSVTTDGRKAAIDMRLMGSESNTLWSKVNLAIDKVAAIHKREEKNKGTQVVWLDMGVPQNEKKKKSNPDEDANLDDDDQPDTGRYDMYREIKEQLISKGIPADQIAFIHDADSNAKRQRLFRDMNEGKIRILIANTKKAGTGANIQKRIAAMHHIDAPWKPADMTQRDGRAIRQGNTYKDLGGVELYRYVTKGSFDAYLWQLLENKDGMIQQIMQGEIDVSDDTGAVSLDADEVKALASANPDVMRLVKLEAAVERMAAEERGFHNDQMAVRHDLNWYESSMRNQEDRLKKYEKAVESLPDVDDYSLELTIGDKSYDKAKEVGKAYFKAIEAARHGEVFATSHGLEFKKVLEKTVDGEKFYANVFHDGNPVGQVESSEDETGMGMRIKNQVASIYEKPDEIKASIAHYQKMYDQRKKSLQDEWENQSEFDAKAEELAELQSRIGNANDDTRNVTPLFKTAILAEELSNHHKKPVKFDTGRDRWEFSDDSPIDPKQVERGQEMADDRIEELLSLFEEEATPELFFNPKGRVKAKPKAKPKRPKSSLDDQGRQPPVDGRMAYSGETDEKKGTKNGPTRPQGRRGEAKNQDEASAEETGPISHTAITKRVEKIWDVVIRAGRLYGRDADGEYVMSTKNRAGIMKTASPHVLRQVKQKIGDLGVQAHELAHHIDETTDILKSVTKAKLKQELWNLDYHPNRKGPKAKKIALQEGFAEFMRFWLSQPPTGPFSAVAQSPKLVDWLNEQMDKNPELAKKLERTRKLYRSYYDQSAQQRSRSQIVDGDAPERPAEETTAEFLAAAAFDVAQQIEADWIDQYAVLKRLDELSAKNGYKFRDKDGKVIKNGAYDLRMAYLYAAPQHTQQAVLNGIHSVDETSEVLSKTSLAKAKEEAGIESGEDYSNALSYIHASFAKILHEDEAKRIAEKAKKNKKWKDKKPAYNPGIMLEDAEAIIDATSEKDRKRYDILWDAITDTNRALMELEVRAGLLTQKEMNALIEKYPRYVPLKRIFDKGVAKKLGSSAIDVRSTVKKRSSKGSDAPILDPVLATINRINATYTAVFDQNVLRQMADQADSTNGMGGLMVRVPRNTKVSKATVAEVLADKEIIAKLDSMGLDVDMIREDEELQAMAFSLYRKEMRGSKGELIIPIRRAVKGKTTVDLYQLDHKLYDAISQTPDALNDGLVKAFGIATKVIRTGAVGLNAAFGLKNAVVDWKAFQERSRYTSGLETIVSPIWSVLKYAAEGTGFKAPTDINQLYKEMGGLLATRYGVGSNQSMDIREQGLGLKPAEKKRHLIRDWGRKAVRFGHKMESMIAVSDVGPRIAEFTGVLRSHGYIQEGGTLYHVDENGKKTKKRPPQNVLVEAINAASEATVNFKKRGAKAMTVNQFIPFFTASIASANKQYRVAKAAFGKDPSAANQKRVIVANTAIALLTAYYWAMRHGDDDYEEQQDWLKYGYWTITDNAGNPVVRIPKGYEESIVPNMVEGLLNSYDKNDQDAFVTAMWETLKKVVPPYEVAGIMGAAEAWANYDTFREAPIENLSMQRYEKTERTKPWTTEFSKWLSAWGGSQLLNLSPAQIDHIISRGTGGLGTKALTTVEGSVEAVFSEDHNTEKLEKGLWMTADPTRGLRLERDFTKSVNELYDKATKTQQRIDTMRKRGEEPSSEQLAEASKFSRVKALNSDLRDILDENNIRDRDERFAIEKYIVGLSRWALGKKDSKRYANPLRLSKLSEQARPAVEDALTKVIVRAILQYDGNNETHRQSIQSAQDFLKATGLTKGEAASLLSKHYRSEPLSRNRYSREQTIKKRAANRQRLMRLMSK